MEDERMPEPAQWEELSYLEKEFDYADNEIIIAQAAIQAPLYEKRRELTSRMPDFWPTVFQQSPPEIDSFIQLADAEALSSLKDMTVTRFQIPPASGDKPLLGAGSPRSIAFRFEFAKNDFFEDTVLEKKFYFRRSKKDMSTSLVSDPVKIKWKAGKDLTEGLLDAAIAAWESESKQVNGDADAKTKKQTPEEEKLEKKLETVSDDALSFFAWFGYRGARVSDEEAVEAGKLDALRTAQIHDHSKNLRPSDNEKLEAEGKEPEDPAVELEIFPFGEELAIALSDELWPNALKYFTQAYEEQSGSEDDFEEDVGSDEISDLEKLVGNGNGNPSDDDDEEEDEKAPPKKKQRS